MSSYFHALDPNGRDPVLSDCSFYFYDIEPAPGILMSGWAEIETDGSNYAIGSVYTGDDEGKNREWWPAGHPIQEMAARVLIRDFDDEIIEACCEAGR